MTTRTKLAAAICSAGLLLTPAAALAGGHKNPNAATGIGDATCGECVPPGQTDDPKGNAPGQVKKNDD